MQRDVLRGRVLRYPFQVALDRRQRETVRLQLTYELQPGDVIGTVVAVAALAARRWDESTSGVEPHRTHGHADPGGKLLDAQGVGG